MMFKLKMAVLKQLLYLVHETYCIVDHWMYELDLLIDRLYDLKEDLD